MSIADSGILTNLEQAILTVFQGGFSKIQPDALHLLSLLGTLDLVLAAIFWTMEQKDFTATFLRKILIISLFIYFIQNWQSLVDVVVHGFTYIGAKAGGGSNLPALTDPSSIIDFSWKVSEPLNTEITKLNKASWFGFNAMIADLWICKILILVSLAIVAIQSFICYLEFYLVAVLTMILLPFGVFKHTAFLAEKAFGAVIAFGIKLMVLSFILSVSMPVIQAYTIPDSPSFQQAASIGIAVLALAILSITAPKMASGIMSGSPSLTISDAAKVVTATTAGAVLGASSAMKVGGGISGVAKSGYSKVMAAANHINRKS
ncbi:MAG: P-type conjugative transfer protein TrbL [Pseudomonadota bacterium]